MKTLDDLRAKYPHLGYALYAYTPGGPVTLECLAPDGNSFKFVGATEAEAVAKFDDEDDTPAPSPEPERLAPAPPAPPAPAPSSVFD